VLDLVAAGLTDAAIGRRLGLATSTVSKHLQRVYRRHHLGNRAVATLWWVERRDR
jgi:DNA-binding NarL/FixJ family response regulator